jgi:tetratricopeptide (TPR) repeat protein
MSEFKEGIYAETTVQNIGTGSTARSQEYKSYYLARPADDGQVKIQVLDMNDEPLPYVELVPLDEFERRFTYEPDYLKTKKSPKEKKVDKAIAQAEAHVRRKEYYSAEFEYDKALKLDEDNVRANFGVGKVYLATGETEKAKATFQKLSQVEAVFEAENKHIFNELGIELRRLHLYDQAIDYYLKALTFTRDDEHLFFNTARAYFDAGDLKNTEKLLKCALKLNPKLPEARKLLYNIKKGGA